MSRAVCLLLAVFLLVAPVAEATWSIVLVDTQTGEVAVGGATCLTNFDLQRLLPVVVVGKGGAAAQSSIDTGATNRKKIWEQLMLGTPADEIIEITKQGDLFKASRQYGVVESSPTAAGFTGNSAFGYKEDRQGTIGTLVYSIQGNVLAGVQVMDAMEVSLLSSDGLATAERLMLAMEAARVTGGDGRCWCGENQPASCPPEEFDPEVDKTAHIGFMVLARLGDEDGVCTAGQGCANGDYYMSLNVTFQPVEAPDPVLQLADQYAVFKADQVGRPDGVTSSFELDADEVVAGGGDLRTLTVTVRDIDGAPLDANGLDVEVVHAPGSAGSSTIESVAVGAGGEIVVSLRAGDEVGTDVFDVRISDDVGSATVAPRPELRSVASLTSGPGASVLDGGVVPFELRAPDGSAGKSFALALSASGTEPGIELEPGLVLPLNPDRLYDASGALSAAGFLVGSPSAFDEDGAAKALLRVPSGVFLDLAGLEIAAAWVTLGAEPFASSPATFELRP